MTSKSDVVKKAEKAANPVSPRTPRAEVPARFSADSSGDTRERTPAKATKQGKLNFYEVTHDGHDTRGRSLAAADSEGRARQLVGDVLAANDLGHTHGLMEVRQIDKDRVPSGFTTSKEGAALVDNGKHP